MRIDYKNKTAEWRLIMKITRRMSPNRNIGRQGWQPDMIVCHITEGTFDGSVTWITNPVSQVSYHFVVACDGRIVQAVDICNTAWANGTTRNNDNRDSRHSSLHMVRERGVNANLYTVSIGFEGRLAETQGALTQEQLEAALWLIAHIREEIRCLYSVQGTLFPLSRQHIVGHHEITPQTRPNCPGPKFPYDVIIQYLHVKPTGQLGSWELSLAPEASESFATQPPCDHTPSVWAREAWEWAFNNRITDGTNPRGQPTREQVMQLLFNYHNKIFLHQAISKP